MKLTTTLVRIRSHSPCKRGYTRLAKSLGGVRAYGDDAEINLLAILDANGVQDMLWCLRATIEDSRKVAERLVTEFVAEADAMTSYYPDDSLDQLRHVIHERLLYVTQMVRHACADPASAAATAASYAASHAAYVSAASYGTGKKRGKAIARQEKFIRSILSADEEEQAKAEVDPSRRIQ